jgi:hypothetical protein
MVQAIGPITPEAAYLLHLYDQTKKVENRVEQLGVQQLIDPTLREVAGKIGLYDIDGKVSVGKKPGFFARVWNAICFWRPSFKTQERNALHDIKSKAEKIDLKFLDADQAAKLQKVQKIFNKVLDDRRFGMKDIHFKEHEEKGRFPEIGPEVRPAAVRVGVAFPKVGIGEEEEERLERELEARAAAARKEAVKPGEAPKVEPRLPGPVVPPPVKEEHPPVQEYRRPLPEPPKEDESARRPLPLPPPEIEPKVAEAAPKLQEKPAEEPPKPDEHPVEEGYVPPEAPPLDMEAAAPEEIPQPLAEAPKQEKPIVHHELPKGDAALIKEIQAGKQLKIAEQKPSFKEPRQEPSEPEEVYRNRLIKFYENLEKPTDRQLQRLKQLKIEEPLADMEEPEEQGEEAPAEGEAERIMPWQKTVKGKEALQREQELLVQQKRTEEKARLEKDKIEKEEETKRKEAAKRKQQEVSDRMKQQAKPAPRAALLSGITTPPSLKKVGEPIKPKEEATDGFGKILKGVPKFEQGKQDIDQSAEEWDEENKPPNIPKE